MSHKKFLILALVALMALGSFSFAMAQDTLPPVTLTVWSADEDEINANYQALFDQWAAERSPGSTIEFTNVMVEQMRNDLLTAGLAGSGLPDLFIGPNDPIGVYVDAGLVQPMDDLFDLSLYNGTLSAGQLNGVTYGIPISSGNHLMLLYNKDYVTEAPQTWEELVATAKQIEADHPGVQGFAYNENEPFWFLPFVGGFGGTVFDEEGNFTLDSQAWTDAFQFVHDLKFTDQVVPQECDYDCANSLFSSGDAAMIINGDWSLSGYLDTETAPALGADKLGVAPWPELANGSRPTPYTSGRFVSVPVTTTGDKLNAIVDWLTWLSTDQDAIQQLTLDIGRLPAVNEAPAIEDDPILSASSEALATGIGMPSNIELRCMWDAVRPQLEGVMSDSIAPADASAAAQASADECVADLE
jgi:arabinogalactan oligomer / maltooligosaccharide transport system substrate-binding protein